jgi:predicted RNA-binding protein with PUA-like domain
MMQDDMKLGDQVFFYHSNCDVPGISGIIPLKELKLYLELADLALVKRGNRLSII